MKNQSRTILERAPALYKGIVQDLQTRITQGEIVPGARLPSINDLSRNYGVSTITVRAALRELAADGVVESRPRSGVFVCEKAVREKNGAASGLLRDAIAVLSQVPIEADARVPHTWSRDIGIGAARAIRDAGRHAFALHPDRFIGREVERLADEQPIGVIFTELNPQWERAVKVARELTRRGVPVVVYGGAPELAGFDRVMSDHEAGSYELVKFLISQGRRRLLNVWTAPAKGYWFARRRAGYERALAEAGLKAWPDLIVPSFVPSAGSLESFEASTRRLAGHFIESFSAKPPIDALLMSTDVDALGAAAACLLFGKTPNKDVAIAGYDNFWRDCGEREFAPALPLVTVDKRDEEMGGELVKMLLDRVAGRLPDASQSRVVPPRLIHPNDL